MVNTDTTSKRVSVIVPLRHVWGEEMMLDDQKTTFNTDLWMRHIRKHHDDTLDWGGDSEEMEKYMGAIEGV